jgi:hypothetical protein
MELEIDRITFGKYKDKYISDILKDRKYCSWLISQEWFKNNYEYIYNKVLSWKPSTYFMNLPEYNFEKKMDEKHFLENYHYFHLTPLNNLKISLTEEEKNCYKFYLETIENLKNQIGNNINPFDIKAPTSWLKKFEEKYKIQREKFKQFLESYELKNIPYIIEDIKKCGGIEYKGARSYLIAKENSVVQEHFWEKLLKKYYGENIGTQYKFKNCFFDFINISKNTLYECKLGIKDFDKKQYEKYLSTLGTFNFIYLIGNDCVIDIQNKTVYSTDIEKYSLVKTWKLTSDFSLKKLEDVEDFFKV